MTRSYHDFDTPIGTLRLVGDERHIARVDLPNAAARQPDTAWQKARRTLPAALRTAKRQLAEYFDGTRRDFELPLHPDGTPFQHRVWDELRRIPYGETISYGELAPPHRQADGVTRGGRGQRTEPTRDRRALPPRDRRRRHAHRLWRGAPGQGSALGPRTAGHAQGAASGSPGRRLTAGYR